jgi:hypothetical protein
MLLRELGSESRPLDSRRWLAPAARFPGRSPRQTHFMAAYPLLWSCGSCQDEVGRRGEREKGNDRMHLSYLLPFSPVSAQAGQRRQCSL